MLAGVYAYDEDLNIRVVDGEMGAHLAAKTIAFEDDSLLGGTKQRLARQGFSIFLLQSPGVILLFWKSSQAARADKQMLFQVQPAFSGNR